MTKSRKIHARAKRAALLSGAVAWLCVNFEVPFNSAFLAFGGVNAWVAVRDMLRGLAHRDAVKDRAYNVYADRIMRRYLGKTYRK